MKTRHLALILAAFSLAPTSALANGGPPGGGLEGGVTDIGQTPLYSQTAWASIHRDSRNSDFSPFVAPAANQVEWTALDGAATLTSFSIGPEGNHYIATGQGPGTSHLHAFDRDGNVLWESAPQASLADLDSGAISSAPLVDAAGDVYLADLNQLWAFHADGTVKWAADLPASDSPFITAIITNEGFVGGITTKGAVALFNRDDGSSAVPVFQLPAGDPPPAPPPRPGLWVNGLMDPAVIPLVEPAFFGAMVTVANTPAVHPETGRIYITAAGPLDGGGGFTGLLYGLDIVDGEIEIAFASPMGGGSGTSPAISPDGTQIYAADGDGLMNAFDAQTGATLWVATGAAGAASPGVGPDGTVYSGDPAPSASLTVVALDPDDGSTLWAQNYDALGAALPQLPPVPPFFPTGQPIVRFNSVVSTSAQKVWVVLTAGYEFFNPAAGTSRLQPRVTLLAALDPVDGSVISTTPLRDTNEGVVTFGSDGSIYTDHSAILSSVFFYGINPLLQGAGLPAPYLAPGPPPGGVTSLGPVSLVDHMAESIEWVQSLNASALAELPGGNVDAALTATRRGRTQLQATLESVDDAVDSGELDAATASALKLKLDVAAGLINNARTLLATNNPTVAKQQNAAARLTLSSEALDEALALLAP